LVSCGRIRRQAQKKPPARGRRFSVTLEAELRSVAL
jgi:hypothetical protein